MERKRTAIYGIVCLPINWSIHQACWAKSTVFSKIKLLMEKPY